MYKAIRAVCGPRGLSRCSFRDAASVEWEFIRKSAISRIRGFARRASLPVTLKPFRIFGAKASVRSVLSDLRNIAYVYQVFFTDGPYLDYFSGGLATIRAAHAQLWS
jgi:hypothetical protein